jgi:hypothetical protein
VGCRRDSISYINKVEIDTVLNEKPQGSSDCHTKLTVPRGREYAGAKITAVWDVEQPGNLLGEADPQQLRTGAGVPATIIAIKDSTVEVAVEFIERTEVLKVETWDILPSNLYTHSILNVVYQTYQVIEHEHGSILNLTAEEIVAQLNQQGLAPLTARRCAELFDEVDWLKAQLPLRQWLRRIRDFYHVRA